MDPESDRCVDIAAQLDGHWPILHRTRRGWFEKRITQGPSGPVVLYRFLRRRHAHRLAWMLDAARAEGAALQPWLGGVADPAAALRHRGYWVATGYAEGEPVLGVAEHAHLAALGRTLARLHRLEGPNSGPLFSLTPPVPGTAPLRRRLAQAVRHFGGHHAAMADHRPALRRWLDHCTPFPALEPPFSLIHGDLYGGNLLARPDGGITLVDYELAAFEPAGLELAVALLRTFCNEDPQRRRALLDPYLAEASALTRERWETHSAFFLTAAALQLAAQRRKRARRLVRLGRSPRPALELARQYERWVLALIQADPRQPHATDELLALCS